MNQIVVQKVKSSSFKVFEIKAALINHLSVSNFKENLIANKFCNCSPL